MVAIAIVSTDPVLRRDLAQVLRGEPMITAVSVVDDPDAVMTDQDQLGVILVDALSRKQLADLQIQDGKLAIIALLDGADDVQTSRDALQAGARAILSRSAGGEEIVATIKAVMGGLAVLPYELAQTLFDGGSLGGESMDRVDRAHARLTPRELEVLTAMADGASNKVIARRLGISVHTVKFHVAGILAKLRADSRTEAVMRAAQLGLVML
jgi:DNA-binding NarL/FixJ family response regulator